MSPLGILVINPNSSNSITSALRKALQSLETTELQLNYFNPSTGPPGIKDVETATASCDACMSELQQPEMDIGRYDGFLVACFSEHPLIETLQQLLDQRGVDARVMGIVHAGISAALLTSRERFGILATGTDDKPNLVQAVASMTGTPHSSRFAGVLTTGLQVVDLQDGDQALVERNMKETVRRLMDKGAATIVFGCAGMSGMDAWVHAVASEQGRRVKVIDGARVGVEFLAGLIRSSR